MSFRINLSECEVALQAQLVGDDVAVTGVSIDTRTLQAGDLYIAIHGEQFDGHAFIKEAEFAGAKALLVHDSVDSELPQLKVNNTVEALGQLARLWAQRFCIPTIAITGSNGKTTVKEIVTTILRQLGPVLSTKGNLNNEIGVPLTLLNMRAEHLYAVIEMGANHAGEIARLVDIAEPDVAVVNNIGTAHLEGFGSVEGIARAKSEIYAGLRPQGYAVLNADDAFADFMREAASHCTIREFGLAAGSDVQGVPGAGLNIRTMSKSLSPRFPLSGDHNGMNALAAVAAVQCLDVQAVSIVRGLENVRPVPGRLEKKPGFNGATLIDDSYNANPDSAEQAVNVLARHDGIRYLVLGDMGELGADEESLHARVGAYARKQGLDGLWTTGALASFAQKAFSGTSTEPTTGSRAAPSSASSTLAGGGMATQHKARVAKKNPLSAVPVSTGAHHADQEALVSHLKQHLAEGVTVLVKGSRSAKMERVVKALMPVAKARRESVQEQRS